MGLRGSGLVGAGIQHLAAQLIVHSRFEDHGHVVHGAHMLRVVQSHAIGEVGGLTESQLLQLFVHEFHKCLVGSGHIGGKAQRRVGAGGKNGAVEQFPDGHGLAYVQAHHAASVHIAVVCDVDGHGKGIIQIRHMLGGNQKREDLGHGGGGDDRTGLFFRQNGLVVQIHHNGIGAGELLAQLDGLRRLRNGERLFRLCCLGRGLHGLRGCGHHRLLRHIFSRAVGGHGGEQYYKHAAQQEKGRHEQQLTPAALLLLFLSGGCTLGSPGGAFFFGESGGVVSFHRAAPVLCMIFSL